MRYWQKYLAIDQERLAQQERERAMAELTEDPMGRHRFDPPPKYGRSVFNKYRR